MRQVTRKGLITMAAAGGAIALGGGYAHAGAEAFGGASNSPGVASGNSVQVPVSVPVNACGNTVNAVALLNPSFGNNCANHSGSAGAAAKPVGSEPGGAQPGQLPAQAAPGGGATAVGGTSNSPGVASGNNAQVPVEVPVNACGNSVNVGGLLNPAFGNGCANAPAENPPVTPVEPPSPGKPVTPVEPPKPPEPNEPGPNEPGNPAKPSKPGENPTDTPPPGETPGANGPSAHHAEKPKVVEQLAHTGVDSLGLIVPVGAGMLLAGAVLYRRARAAA